MPGKGGSKRTPDPAGTPKPPRNPPAKRRPNPPQPPEPVIPSTLPPVEIDYSPGKCPVDNTMFDHRLNTDEEVNKLSWANPVLGTKEDGTRVPGDLWSIWSAMASTMKRFMVQKGGLVDDDILMKTCCLEMQVKLNAIWGRSMKLFMGWMVDPTWKADWNGPFFDTGYHVSDVKAITTGTCFVDLHSFLEVDDANPDVITPRSGTLTPKQEAAHAILFLSMCVARAAGLTAKRENDPNGLMLITTYDIWAAILWTCQILGTYLNMVTTDIVTITPMTEYIGQMFRHQIATLDIDESKNPFWDRLPVIEKGTPEMAKGFIIINRWPKETDLSVPPKKNIWKGAPHNASTQESNFQFRADYDKNIGEMLITLFFKQAAHDWSDGFRENCLGVLSSGITNPFVANPPANVQAMAKVFYEPPTGRADPNWWDEMQLRFDQFVYMILNEPPPKPDPPDSPIYTPPSSPRCTIPCKPVKNRLTKECQALPDLYVPKDPSVPVTDQTPIDQMDKWDGTPIPKAYEPKLQMDGTGNVAIDPATNLPILVGWTEVPNPSVPSIPDECKPKPPTCTICTPFRDKDGSCKSQMPLYTPKDPSVPVDPNNPFVDMEPVKLTFTDKDPKMVYTPNVTQKPDGTVVLNGWIPVNPNTIDPNPKPPPGCEPDPDPSGGGGGGGGEGALALILLLVLALLFFSRRR